MKLQLIAVPYDSGVRGVRMGAGPEHLLKRGIVSHLQGRGHDVEVGIVEAPAHPVPSEIATAFGLMGRVADAVKKASADGRFPIVLSGSCYSTVGALAGLGSGDIAVIWFDSHADFNTPETTTTAFLDGMATSILTGRCWHQMAAGIPGFQPLPDQALVFCGVRDVDPLESELLERSEIRLLQAEAVGGGDLGASRAYLHIDLDALDPSEGRANELAAPDGLSLEELSRCVRGVADAATVCGVSITAYDPAFDPKGRVSGAAFSLVDAVLGG